VSETAGGPWALKISLRRPRCETIVNDLFESSSSRRAFRHGGTIFFAPALDTGEGQGRLAPANTIRKGVKQMKKAEKEASVQSFREELDGAQIAIVTQYQGITVEQVTRLRTRLREKGVTFRVYKNTLAKRALDERGLGAVAKFMEGPTAWAFCKDPVAPAKVLKEFSKEVGKVAMRGGILDGKAVTGAQLKALAELPSREVLLSQLVGTFAAPIRKFLGTLEAVPRNFVNVLDQVKKQKEEQGGAA
jgi:large subunit ribosomal protein L10